MHQFFILDQQEIDTKIKSLLKKETSKDGWSHLYQSGAEEWVLTRFHSDNFLLHESRRYW
jgi:hypothetical protein